MSADQIVWNFEGESNYQFSIPSSWVIEKSQIAFNEVRDGTHDSPKEVAEGVPLVTSKNLIAGKIDFTNTKTISFSDHEEISKRSAVQHGDLLFSMIGTIGNVAVVPKDAIFSVKNVGLFRKNPLLLDERYSYYWLESETYQRYLDTLKRGGNQKFVSLGVLRDSPVIIPPLAEQQQIAQKLDELLVQVDTLKTRLDAIPNILKRFRQSVLAAAVSGRLTEGGDTWPIVKIGEIVEKIEAGKNLQCIETPPQEDQYGIIKISAVTWGVYDEEESKTLPDFDLFMESRRINVGDFLISRANTIELLGNPVIVHKVTKNLMLSDKVLRLVMREENKYWLSIFLRSHFGRKQIEEKSTGNQMSMRNIGQKALLDIDMPKPPLEEQTEIVRRVEQLFAYADQIEQRVKDAQARVNHLTQSILAKAFRGELTADWRAQNPELISGENSAAALLERIKAEREAAVKPKRKGK